jgi:photosystem II stability/assembly factor-like uncharacterized protein
MTDKIIAMKFYILAFLLLFMVFSCFVLPGCRPDPKTGNAGTAKTVFRSTDGGLTWQDIGTGLPENLREDSIRVNRVFANDKGLFLKVGNGLYHSTPNGTAPFWTKEVFPDEHSSIAPGKPGIFVCNYWAVNLKKTNGTSVWSTISENFRGPRMRAFETAGGAIFIGTDNGLFKTANDGKTWEHVHDGGFVGNLAESNGVLAAISMGRIIRSVDNGENWAVVDSGDGTAFDVKQFRGGFVAITSSSDRLSPNASRLRTSFDGGKTWQPIETGLPDKVVIDSISRTWNDRPWVRAFITPIIQVGEDLFCTCHDGIFRSSDKGRTWQLSFPSVHDKAFNVFVSGNVIYAIRSKGGC